MKCDGRREKNLLQSASALFAYAPVDIVAKIFFACRASPVDCGKAAKRRDANELQSKDGALREFSEDIIAFIKQGKNNNAQQCYCYSEKLAALAQPEIPFNL